MITAASQRFLPLWAVMLFVPALVFLPVACSNGEGTEGEGAAPATAPPTTATESQPPMPTADPDVPNIDRELQERRAVEEKRQVLAARYVALANQQLNAGEFAKAETLALRALEQVPTYEPAVDVFQRARVAQGDEAATNADIARSLVDRRRVQREKRAAEVRDHYVRALQAQRAGKLEEAMDALDRANVLITFDPFSTDFSDPTYGDLAQKVSQQREEVQRALLATRKAREQEGYEEAYQALREEELRRREREMEEVRLLMSSAVKRFAAQDFDNAEQLARKVLRINPGLRKARELVEEATAARRVAWRQTYYAERREAWQSWLEGMRESQIPYTQLLQWMDADDWRQLRTTRRVGDRVDQERDETPADRALRTRLENEIVTFEFRGADDPEMGVPFADVVDQLRSQYGLNLMVSVEVLDSVDEVPPLSLPDMPLGRALGELLRAVSTEDVKLGHAVRNGVLHITTAGKALGKPIARIYEVRDLTAPLANFEAPDLNLRSGGGANPEGDRTAVYGKSLEATPPANDVDTLLVTIQQSVRGEDFWSENEFSIEPAGSRLLVKATPEIHTEVESFLEDLRRFNKLVVHVEARFIQITKANLLEIGVDWRGLGGSNPGTVALLDDVTNGAPNLASLGLDNGQPGGAAAVSLSPTSGAFFSEPNSEFRARTENIFDRTLGSILSGQGGATVAFTLLDDLEMTQLLRAVEQSANATLVNAPNLTIYNNQRANLILVNQISYVKDYDVEVAQTAFIADPQVDVIQDGLTLDVRPTVSHDRRYVTMEVRPTVASLVRPIRTFETTLSGLTTPVVIELPEIEVKQANTTVKVPDNGYLLIGGFKQISTVDRRAEVPILSNIPLVSFFFSKKGRSDEMRDLMIVLHVEIVDLSEREAALGG